MIIEKYENARSDIDNIIELNMDPSGPQTLHFVDVITDVTGNINYYYEM